MKNIVDYSLYECPFSNVEKDCGHELKGPEGYKDVYSVWCACGFRGPIFYLDPKDLNLKKKQNDNDYINQHQKQNTWHSKKYRKWVSSLPCCVTRSQGPNSPHHVKKTGNSGTGQKPSDYWCIPLRHDLHHELHQNGAETFEKTYNISLVDCVLATCQKWIENHK